MFVQKNNNFSYALGSIGTNRHFVTGVTDHLSNTNKFDLWIVDGHKKSRFKIWLTVPLREI